MKYILSFILLLIGYGYASAQPGPVPDPWNYGPSLSLFYNNGGVTLGTPTGGTQGPGTVNVSGGFFVNGTPITTIGSQAANLFYASPNGASGTPVFRSIVNGDLPSNLTLSGTFSASIISGTWAGAPISLATQVSGNLPVSSLAGGVGATTNTFFRGDGTWATPAGTSTSISMTVPPFLTVAGSPVINNGSFVISATNEPQGLFLASPAGGTGGMAPRTIVASDLRTAQGATGFVGDGVTSNNAAMQAALTSAGLSGGFIYLPCGVYNFTNILTITANIAPGKNITLTGSGVDCTVLYFTNSPGIKLTYGGLYSSFNVRDMTFETDQAGLFDAITLTEAGVNTNPAISAQSIMTGVNFIGSDSYSGAPTKYWRNGYSETNISNINMDNIMYIGPVGGFGGNVVSLLGNVAGGGYSVAINITRLSANLQGSCIKVGDYVQGLTVRSMNCTSGVNGVIFPSSASGVLGEFIIESSQFGGNTGRDVDVPTPNANIVDVKLSDDYFIDVGTGGGIVIAGSRPTLTALTFAGGPATGTAITMNGSAGTITGGSIVGYAVGVKYGPTANSIVETGTRMAANTVDYVFDVAAVNTTVNDMNQRTYTSLTTGASQIPCVVSNNSSSFNIIDAITPTYNGVITGGGATAVTAKCVGSASSWRSQ